MLKALKQVWKPLAFTITYVLVTFRPYSLLSCFVLLFCSSNWWISSSLDCLVLTRPQDIVFIFLYHPHLFQTVPINCFSMFTHGTYILPKIEAKMQWVIFFPCPAIKSGSVLPVTPTHCCLHDHYERPYCLSYCVIRRVSLLASYFYYIPFSNQSYPLQLKHPKPIIKKKKLLIMPVKVEYY